MKAKDFEKNSQEIIGHCWELLFSKAKEYSNDGDRLANFKAPTSLLDTNQANVCLMYDMKHIASMVKMAKDVDKGIIPSKELLIEKVGDYINYGLLFYSNMLELMQTDKETLTIRDIDGEKHHFTCEMVKEILNDQD